MRRTLPAGVIGAVLLVFPGAVGLPTSRHPQATVLTQAARGELSAAPTVGVFDAMAFRIDGPLVILSGFAHGAASADDIVRRAKRITGADNVVNRIQILPRSAGDERIRWALYRAIYHDDEPLTSIPSGEPWAEVTAPPSPSPTNASDTFERSWIISSQLPIQILVRDGVVTLIGDVQSDRQRLRAVTLARRARDVTTVIDQLRVVATGSNS